MKADEIFARRLRNARVMAGYSMDDLVRKMGNSVSKMTISKLEFLCFDVLIILKTEG